VRLRLFFRRRSAPACGRVAARRCGRVSPGKQRRRTHDKKEEDVRGFVFVFVFVLVFAFAFVFAEGGGLRPRAAE